MKSIKEILVQKNSLEGWLRLALTHGVGPRTILNLLQHFGNIENILKQNLDILEKFVIRSTAKLICNGSSDKMVEKSFHWLNEAPNRHIISIQDSLYPNNLLQISDPPAILYLEGNISLLQNRKISIVGTRHPTDQGKENAVSFARDLSNNGFTIVSGMASGIDRYAHLGGMAGKSSSIGVIGTGMDIKYPKSNKDIYDRMEISGLIISEFALGVSPFSKNFPRRNRIVAGLSDGILVVESTIDGGSLISANFANEMGREVMAIPGSIFNPVAAGCHKLIKSGAKLVENINDILEELRFHSFKDDSIKSLVEPKTVDPILNAMGFEPINIDTICEKASKDFSEICAKLLEFELSGLITNCGSGYYQRIFKQC